MKLPRLITRPVRVVDNVATGKACRAWRKWMGVNQCNVAEEMQLSQAMVSGLEDGSKGWNADKLAYYVRAVTDIDDRRKGL